MRDYNSKARARVERVVLPHQLNIQLRHRWEGWTVHQRAGSSLVRMLNIRRQFLQCAIYHLLTQSKFIVVLVEEAPSARHVAYCIRNSERGLWAQNEKWKEEEKEQQG